MAIRFWFDETGAEQLRRTDGLSERMTHNVGLVRHIKDEDVLIIQDLT